LDQIATEEEQNWYEELIWINKFNKNYTYKSIVRKMAREYRGE
jgi:hypothetical protein